MSFFILFTTHFPWRWQWLIVAATYSFVLFPTPPFLVAASFALLYYLSPYIFYWFSSGCSLANT